MVNYKAEKITMQGEEVVSWEGIKPGEECQAMELHGAVDMHVQVIGDLGGGSLILRGSNVLAPKDTDWATTTDGQGFGLWFTVPNLIRRCHVAPRWIRPLLEGGDKNADVTVLIAMRKG